MSSDDLLSLLFEARSYNHHHGITGMLLSHGQAFMQLLEGEQDEIRALFTKISRDARHRDIVLEHDGPDDSRLFPQWSMAYVDVPMLDGEPVMVDSETEVQALADVQALPAGHACAVLLKSFLMGNGDHDAR